MHYLKEKIQEMLYLCYILNKLFVNVKQFIEESGVRFMIINQLR